jgi:CheY-like chemotaxis protein
LLHSLDPQLRKMARQWLEAYQVVAVGDAAQIPERARQHLPQAVLVDLGQAADPGLSARDLPYPLPVIGFLCPGGLGQNRNLPPGVTDYLVKPVSRQVLIEAVQRLKPQARRLLLVEDDPAMVRFVGQAFKSAEADRLSGEECQVSSASTGEAALRLIEEQAFDAVLLDLQLPDMHGMEVLEQMRRLPHPAPPVIVLSAMDLPQVFFHQGQVVLDVRLNRPLSSAELSAILKALVETIQPVFPKMGDLATPALPASVSA